MRKFLIKISYTVLPVWLFFVGMATYLWVTDDNAGDLMRLGLINSGPGYTDSIRDIIFQQIYYTGQEEDSLMRADTADVVVIGDSFSHGGGVGKEGDYVNYLAHDSGRKVVVFTPMDPAIANPMQVAYDAMKLGVLDSVNAPNLVIQEGERYLVTRHSQFVTTDTVVPHSAPRKAAADGGAKQEASPLLRVKDYFFYHLFGANPIYKERLNRPMFTGGEPDQLYFYNEDVKYGFDITPQQQREIVDCFNQVIAMAREKGINLIIIVACDKYDLYQDYIVDNPYPRKTLVEDVERWMAPQGDRFVYAKRVLLPCVERGDKDVFLFNDTHWSPVSSGLIAAEVIKKLK
ncbi:MAG: hypothetical protein IJV05_04865 [Muribaculaceae bacterium]|nr:hypothetical protein [Muribaculaceae bacterium]